MNSFALDIWDDESELVTFYTVKVEDGASEVDKFFEKYSKIERLEESANDLLSFILDVIGDEYGALDDFFNRDENLVFGLPHKGKAKVDEVVLHYPNFPLRLYAFRINNRHDLVVLFNGGEKTAATNQQSEDLNLKFNDAQIFAKRIDDALNAGMIIVDDRNRRLKSFDGSNEIFL